MQVVDMSAIAVPQTVFKRKKPGLTLIRFFDNWPSLSNNSLR
jgi:hypothetical protein